MNKFTALTLMIGFIVVTAFSDFSHHEILTPTDTQPTEIVEDAEKLESEKSDEAIKDVHAHIDSSEIFISLSHHIAHYTLTSLQKIYKPPKTPFFS